MPNNSFKPNLLRYTKHMADTACHVFGSTTQVGLTQALGILNNAAIRRGIEMGFNIWEVIIVFGVSALIIWRLFQASKKSDSSVTPKSSGETPAYLAGRKLRRTIDSAYTKSRRKSDLEARGLKYDALAKLNALHESDVISDSEFEAEKSEILRR